MAALSDLARGVLEEIALEVWIRESSGLTSSATTQAPGFEVVHPKIYIIGELLDA